MNGIHGKPRPADAAPATEGRMIRWADHYDLFVRLLTLGRDRSIRSMTIELAQIQAGDSVLEVGCGTGTVTLAAKAKAGASGRVAGIDPAPEMIQVARAKAARAGAEIDFRVAAIETLPFPDASFDVVVSSLMMHHLPPDVKRQGVAEVRRVLKPGGHLFVIDFQRPKSLWGHLSASVAVHSMADDSMTVLPPMLRSAGFRDVQTGDTRFGYLGYVRAGV